MNIIFKQKFEIQAAFLIILLQSFDFTSALNGNSEVYLNKCCESGSYYNIEREQCCPVLDNITDQSTYLLGDFLALNSSLVPSGNVPESDDPFIFKLNHFFPEESCTKGHFVLDIDLQGDGERFTSGGHLINEQQYYSAREFCLLRKNSNKISIWICNRVCTRGTPCIKKCCPLNQLWSTAEGCVPADGKVWSPKTFQHIWTGSEEGSVSPQYEVSHPKRWCNKSFHPVLVPEYDPTYHYWKFRTNSEGRLYVRTDAFEAKELERQYYCIDGNATAEVAADGHLPSVLFDCYPHSHSEKQKSVQPLIYGVTMMFSCVCLLVTIFVRFLLWGSQTKTHRASLILLSYFSSLLFMYLFFIIRFFWIMSERHGYDIVCYFVGVGGHFSFLATFAWLSVISFDHWWTFKSILPANRSQRTGFLRSYCKFAAFPLLFSAFIVTVAVSMDLGIGDDYNRSAITPGYGHNCHLHHYYAQLVYGYAPVGVLMMLNLIFFLITVFNLIRAHKSTKMATMNSSRKSCQRNSVAILGKLLVTMGVPWFFEIISWFSQRGRSYNAWYWVVFDVINALQGVVIFWIFVCKRDVIQMLDEKYPSFRRWHHKLTFAGHIFGKIKRSHPALSSPLTSATGSTPVTSYKA